MDPVKISIITRTHALSFAEAAAGAAAIQEQVITDFAPIWKISAIVVALQEPEFGYIPIYIRETIDYPELAGYHTVEKDGAPYAVVQYGPTWTLPASHECLEMIVDPTGERRVSGVLPGENPEMVQFVVEICDPCQSVRSGYHIGDRKWLVSDFCTPAYYDASPSPGAQYDFKRTIEAPKQVLQGGTLGWIASDGHAWQYQNNNGKLDKVDYGNLTIGAMTARERLSKADDRYLALSRSTRTKQHAKQLDKHQAALKHANACHREKYDQDMHCRCEMAKEQGKPPKRKKR
jgi:hypothetical protein